MNMAEKNVTLQSEQLQNAAIVLLLTDTPEKTYFYVGDQFKRNWCCADNTV